MKKKRARRLQQERKEKEQKERREAMLFVANFAYGSERSRGCPYCKVGRLSLFLYKSSKDGMVQEANVVCSSCQLNYFARLSSVLNEDNVDKILYGSSAYAFAERAKSKM